LLFEGEKLGQLRDLEESEKRELTGFMGVDQSSVAIDRRCAPLGSRVGERAVATLKGKGGSAEAEREDGRDGKGGEVHGR